MMKKPTNLSSNENLAGSTRRDEPAFIAVGKIRRTHGVRGELVFEVYTDFPERLIPGKQVFWGDDYRPAVIASIRKHSEGALLRFEGIESSDTAVQFRNCMVWVKTDELPDLPDGEYYLHQLIGFRVVTEDGNVIGSLVDIMETGANDVYIVKTEDSQTELLLPAIESVILSINFPDQKIVIRMPEWL